MGDKMRAEYLQAFRDQSPDVVFTQSPDYTRWEPWIMRANWYFYRELLATYAPAVQRDGYLYEWRRAKENLSRPVPENTAFTLEGGTLAVQTEPGEPCVMDVAICYSITPKDKLSRFLYIGSQADVTDAWSALPQEVNTYPLPGGDHLTAYVPVYIDENGCGSLQVTAYPTGLTTFTLHSAEGAQLLPLPIAYRP